MLSARHLLPFFLLLSACTRSVRPSEAASDTTASVEREVYQAATAALQRDYLDRDTVARVGVSTQPQTQAQDGLVLTVAPVRAEVQPWNSWPDGTARLFNDAVGYLWRVTVKSDREARWSPAHTQLAVNDTEQTFLALAQPDDVLLHLIRGARLETRVGAPPNLALRMRSADDFRRAYLGTDARSGEREGVLLFPAPTRNLQAVAMELTLGIWREPEGVRTYRFLFE